MIQTNLMQDVGTLYDSLDEPEELINFLESFEKKVGLSNNVSLTWMDSSGATRSILSTNGMDEHIQAYIDHMHENPWFHATLSTPELPTICFGEQLVPTKDFLMTAFYNNYLRPASIEQCATIMNIATDHSVMLSVNRSIKHETFDTAFAQHLEPLAPHVLRYGRLLTDSQEVSRTKSLGAAWFDLTTTGVVSMSDNAEALLRKQSALTLSNGSLALANREADRKLRNMVYHISRQDLHLANNSFIDASTNAATLMLLVLPSTNLRTDFSRQYCTTVVVISPERDTIARAVASYQLTPAQTDLAIALANGETLQEFALRSGKSFNTVRVQLRQIFDKTDCRSQAQLVRKLLVEPGYH